MKGLAVLALAVLTFSGPGNRLVSFDLGVFIAQGLLVIIILGTE